VSALPDPTVLLAFGKRVLLSHGDALCLSDIAYQHYRAQVRSAQWQASVLALPLDERRQLAARMRHASEQRHADGAGSPASVDIDPAAALAWMHQAEAPVLVHGHTHQPASASLAPGQLRHVLSDWDLDHSAARPRAEVLRLTRAGFARLPLALAVQASPAA
jgi:UDP-2,3-diacylglucosamine hydrolase